MNKILPLALFATFALPLAAAAQGGSPNEPFILMASDTNRTEIGVAQYVEKHTTDPAALSFARRMISDHSKNEDQVRSLATQVGVPLAPTAPIALTQELQRMSRYSGTALAHAYLSMEVGDHQVAIRSFQAARGQISDKAVLAYISATLPVLQQHLQLAQQDAAKG